MLQWKWIFFPKGIYFLRAKLNKTQSPVLCQSQEQTNSWRSERSLSVAVDTFPHNEAVFKQMRSVPMQGKCRWAIQSFSVSQGLVKQYDMIVTTTKALSVSSGERVNLMEHEEP